MKPRAVVILVLLIAVAQPLFASSLPLGSPLSADGTASPLTYVHAQFDAGLEGGYAVALSPDGTSAYAVASIDDAVSVWRRDDNTGTLTFVERFVDGTGGVDGLDGAKSVAVSPDGKHVYVASAEDDAVAVFSRSATTGRLAYVGIHQDGVGGVDGLWEAHSVVVGPDGTHVYASGFKDDAIAVFSRDAGTGLLTLVETVVDETGLIEALDGIRGLAFDHSGDHLYAAAYNDDAVTSFSRNPTTGGLTFVGAVLDGDHGVSGLDGATGVTVSEDGQNVYVAATTDSAIAAFTRNASTGELTFVDAEADGFGGVDGLANARAVQASPDGSHVYAASSGADNAIAIFSRVPSTGSLDYLGMAQNHYGGIDDMQSPYGLAFDADGSHLYVAAWGQGALLAFDRDAPSGSLSVLDIQRSGDGLDGAVGLAATDSCLYATGNSDSAIAFFRRDAATGRITYQDKRRDGIGGVDHIAEARAVAVPSSGNDVYVAGHGDDAITHFVDTGACHWLDQVAAYVDGAGPIDGLDGVQALAISPDDEHLYAASEVDDAIAIFSRSPSTGDLTFEDWVYDGEPGMMVDGLDGAYAVTVSPDGENVYAAGYVDDAVVAFIRNPANGLLLYIHDIKDGESGAESLNGANSVAVSPDGEHVYVAARIDSAISVFDRNTGGGNLTYLGSVKDGIGGVDGLSGARAIAISPDGGKLFVAAQYEHEVSIFSRDPASGGLSYVGVVRDGSGGVDGIRTPDALALSPVGGHLYVSGYGDDAVAVFARFRILLPLVVKGF